MHVEQFTHNDHDERFWAKMGPFFASPAVRSAVGGFMTSGPQFTWWVAFDERPERSGFPQEGTQSKGDVLGFCAAKREKAGHQVYLTYAYVIPAHRGQGVYTALFQERLAAVLTWPDVGRIYAVCSDSSVGMHAAHGFSPAGSRGQFTIMERILEQVPA